MLRSASVPAVIELGIIEQQKNKWISLALCATLCGHKFYEDKIATYILYL